MQTSATLFPHPTGESGFSFMINEIIIIFPHLTSLKQNFRYVGNFTDFAKINKPLFCLFLRMTKLRSLLRFIFLKFSRTPNNGIEPLWVPSNLSLGICTTLPLKFHLQIFFVRSFYSQVHTDRYLQIEPKFNSQNNKQRSLSLPFSQNNQYYSQ